MAQLIVRGLEDDLKERLQKRAARHNQSVAKEVRDILRDALKQDDEPRSGLGSTIASRFREIGLAPSEAIEELHDTAVQQPF